jgi:hypothetical protein
MCILVVGKDWNEHGGGRGGHLHILQGKPKEFLITINQQSRGEPTKAIPPKAKGLNQIQVVVSHPILRNKVEKTNVEGVVGLTWKIVPIHHMPQF